MQQTDRGRFGSLLADVMAYYGKDVSPFLLSVWWDGCSNIDFEIFAKAMQRHVTDAERGVFPPKVADIVRVLQGTSTDRATLAWGKVLSAISAVGAYQDVAFDDPAIHAAISDCGGWQKICRGEVSELSYLQHRFCQSHKAYVERGGFDYPRILCGDRSPDSEYLKYGRKPPEPILIGDPIRAKSVIAEGGSGGPQITFVSAGDALALPSPHKEAA